MPESNRFSKMPGGRVHHQLLPKVFNPEETQAWTSSSYEVFRRDGGGGGGLGGLGKKWLPGLKTHFCCPQYEVNFSCLSYGLAHTEWPYCGLCKSCYPLQVFSCRVDLYPHKTYTGHPVKDQALSVRFYRVYTGSQFRTWAKTPSSPKRRCGGVMEHLTLEPDDLASSPGSDSCWPSVPERVTYVLCDLFSSMQGVIFLPYGALIFKNF